MNLFSFFNRLSIRSTLILGVAAVHFILMTIFVMDIVQRQKVFLLQTATAAALKQASLTGTAASSWVLADDLAGIEEVLQNSQQDTPIRYALIVDTQGLVLAHTDQRLIGQYLDDSLSLKVLNGSGSPIIWHEDQHTIHSAAAIMVEEHPIGWVLMGLDTTPTYNHLKYVSLSGFLYIIIAIGAGIIFAWLLARYILRQLHLLMEGVDRLGANELDHPIPIIHNDEIGRVGQALNNTMEALKRSRSETRQEMNERRKAEQEIRYLSQRLIGSSEEERKRIGHDLHDELGQMITSFQFGLQSIAGLLPDDPAQARELTHKLSNMAEDMGESVHSIAAHLWPATLEHLGLLVAVRSHINEFNRRRPEMQISFSSQNVSGRLNLQLEIVCFRIIQEALTNIARHAKAQAIEICLDIRNGQLRLFIKDDGIGFDVQSLMKSHGFERGGIGLLGMRERAASIGGQFTIISSKNNGCTVIADLPLYIDGKDIDE